jgi:glycosyltransferase involved in cell wall biosynthesis
MATHNFYIYSNCDFSARSAAATRMLYYAKAIANENNKVYLVTCCSTEIDKHKFSELAPNIFVHKKKELTRNPAKTISFLNKLNRFSRENEGTDTFILYPYPFIFLELFSALYFILIRKNIVYYELNEVRKYASDYHAPYSLKRILYSLKKLKNKTAFALLDKLLPFFKGLICISTNIERYGRRFNKNTYRIPILTDPNIVIFNSEKEYAVKGSFNIGFSGSILPSKENLVSFVNVFNRIVENKHDIRFNLCGSIKPEDHELIESMDLHNRINYHGNLDKNELSAFLSQQDLLILPRGFSLQNKYGFSTKLSDYLNHKKVILVTDISDNKLFIEDGINGFVVPPDSENMMFEKLQYIIDNFEMFKEDIIANAHKTSKEKFDYRLYKSTLPAFLKSWQNKEAVYESI